MPEGTPTGEFFGSEFTSTTDDGALDEWGDEIEEPTEASPEANVTTEETPSNEVAEEETTEEPSEEETPPTAESTETEEEPSEEEPLIFGRFKDLTQAETSYKHMQALQKRTAEESAALRERAERADQLERYFQQVRPVLEQLKQQRQQPQVPEDFDPTDPQQLQAYIDQTVQARLKATEGQFNQKLTQQQLEQQRRAEFDAAQAFWRDHPDAAPETDIDTEIGLIVRELRKGKDGKQVPEAFPLTRENLEIAYSLAVQPQLREVVEALVLDPTDDIIMARATEAIENPQLVKVLKANPDWITTEEGMELAKQHANLPTIVADVKQQATAPDPRQDPRRAFVATGGNGSVNTGPSGEPKDEFDEALEYWQSTRDTIFG